MGATIYTSSSDWTKARRTNSTNSGGFEARGYTRTPPRAGLAGAAGATVMEVVPTRGDGVAQNLMRVKPYAVASDNGTFSIRGWGWAAVNPRDNDPRNNGYDPQLLFEVLCTCCAATGLAGTQVLDTERFCDAISLTTGSTDLVKIVAPGGDIAAYFTFDFLGFPDVELTFNVGANVTSMNALVAGY